MMRKSTKLPLMLTRPSGSAAREYRYFCGLFDDMVFPDLCLLRRKELDGKAGFTCAGCSKDILLRSRNGRFAGSSDPSPLDGKKPAEIRRIA